MPTLRAVASPEPPGAPVSLQEFKSVTQAAKDGTKRELLVAMRDRVALGVEDPGTPARDLAALTKRLIEIVQEIEAIDAREAEEGIQSDRTDEPFDAEAV